MTEDKKFPARGSIEEIEGGELLQPKFDEKGLIPCIAQDADSGEILMFGYRNDTALQASISTGLAPYYSRSRNKLWKKGEQSGHYQRIVSLQIDCDQDCVLIKIKIEGGASCHLGYRSCFFRGLGDLSEKTDFKLDFIEKEKVFDPNDVYKKKN